MLRASLLVSPRPAALLLRRAFARSGKELAQKLAPHVPAGIDATVDERYGDGADALLDVLRPAAATEPLPALVWVHGGAFVGGSKDELRGWFSVVAANGYAVVAPRYSLAPEHRYPTPPRQVMTALAHVQRNAGRLGIDATRIVLGGDSAGGHIAAQVAALATDPVYAEAVGIEPTLAPERLRGAVLACGAFDLTVTNAPTAAGRRFLTTVLWAYSGKRDFLGVPGFANASIVDHVSPAFPPSFVTVGNADPLREHSETLVERLRANGVEVETLFYPAGHEPPLGHEYQFDLDTAEGRLFLDRMLAFLAVRTRTDPAGR